MTMLNSSVALALRSSESMASRSRGLIDGKGDLLLFLKLLLGLGHLLTGIIALSASSGLLGGSASLVGLLGIKHLLPLGLSLLQALLLLLGLSGPLVSLLFPQFLLPSFFCWLSFFSCSA